MTEKESGERKAVLLADDHNIVRQGIQFILEDIIENPIVLNASTIHMIRKQSENNSIDFAILDAQFPDGNCISVIPEIKQRHPEMKILIFSSFDEEKYALKFIQAGADGFLSKLSEESEIRKAIESLIETGKYYSPLTQTLIKIAGRNPDILNPLNQLSERELQIAEMYAKGMGNLEISNHLSIRQNTVSTYKRRIFEKLELHSLVDLIELIKTYHNF